MAEMIDDSFANYVVQTALDYAEGDERAQLVKEIMPLLGSIKTRSWYKRIMNKLGLGINNGGGGHYDSSRHSMPPRQYIDDGIQQRMNSERGSMHGYGQIHGGDRSPDHLPPGFMHSPLLVHILRIVMDIVHNVNNHLIRKFLNSTAISILMVHELQFIIPSIVATANIK